MAKTMQRQPSRILRPRRGSHTAAHISAEAQQAFKIMGTILNLGRVVYMAIKHGRVPKRDAVLTINGKQYRLTLSRTTAAVTLTPIGKEG